jgi:spermidine synthase/MFS family permease
LHEDALSRTTWKVAALLFCSGACALIYQTVWMRQFRLIFGASTGATAAVLAIFMAGLGIGSALLGKRADNTTNPLRMYAHLELLIAAAAAVSPLLLWLAAKIYFGAGGSVTLGMFFATLLRLILAALVLGVATVLMGGTLPAASRAAAATHDEGRRSVALLYGANTLGAVCGTLASTFFMLETFGNRRTLFIAVLLNALVGVVARSLARESEPAPSSVTAASETTTSPRLVLAAAAIVGFAFLLMELVWYRMLAPLLGGSTFTFGLILAIALLGIGLGGAAYSFWSGNRAATTGAFAITCALEAAAIALPFALGDRLAVLALFLRPLGSIGFGGFVLAWTIMLLIVVFPAAFIAGVQCPVLISLLGRRGENVGRQVGAAYAWNTAGAIAGSLAGGFGLLPLLTAPGAWRLVIILLALLGIAASILSSRTARTAAITIAAASIAAVFAMGPTAAWRHSGIGGGRADAADSQNERIDWMNRVRRTVVWEKDGRESSVALVDIGDYAFIVNGKADGSVRGDAGTQVMAGLVPAILHANPQHALVVGLGTGSTAGWLGAVPEMKRVDVVELEPAVVDVARASFAVNHDVLRNPKVNIRIADAREVLLATRERYDLIFSEPSNPWRAGIASLFTREFYLACSERLNPHGLFGQWVQSYEVDAQTVRTIYATLTSVFPHVETWTTDSGDLLLVGSLEPVRYDFDRLRRRVAMEPFRSALAYTWRVESLEGFLAHFLARDTMARAILNTEDEVNTDDRTLVEFGFARGLGVSSRFNMDHLAATARVREEDRPVGTGTIDWAAFSANRATLGYVNAVHPGATQEDHARHRMAANRNNLPQVLAEWRAHPVPPINSSELVAIAEALADSGSAAAEPYAEQLRQVHPVDADAVLARLRFRQGKLDEAAALLRRALLNSRTNPWADFDLFGRSLDLAGTLATTPALARTLLEAMDERFAAGMWDDTRMLFNIVIAYEADACGKTTLRALRAYERWPAWREDILKRRVDCYRTSMMEEFAESAQQDLDRYYMNEAMPFNRDLLRAPSGSSSNPR